FANRLVRQTDNVEGVGPARQLDLHVDGAGFHPLEGKGRDAADHRPSPNRHGSGGPAKGLTFGDYVVDKPARLAVHSPVGGEGAAMSLSGSGAVEIAGKSYPVEYEYNAFIEHGRKRFRGSFT